MLLTLLISYQIDNLKKYKIMINQEFRLVERNGETPEIGQVPPQLQFSDKSPRDIYQKFHDWMFTTFPKVRKEPTRISVPTSIAMWLDENEDVGHIDVLCLLLVVESLLISI